jgi:hypothetical protein
MVKDATGNIEYRFSAILSFADGLVAAGHEVYMLYTGNSAYPSGFHQLRRETIGIYFLVGYAWGRNEWDKLLSEMALIVPSERFIVFTKVVNRVLEHRGPAVLFR